MQDGSMFAVLTQYEKQDFYEENRTIEFDRIFDDGSYEEYEYEVFSAFKTEIGKGFEYYRYANGEDEVRISEYLENIENIENINMITTKRTNGEVSDLMTLSTCSYHVNDGKGRIIVVSYKIALE